MLNLILTILNNWKDLIGGVWHEYPLAAALLTLVAVAVFFYLQEIRPQHTKTNVLLVLLGWAVATPILGFILTVLSKIWGFFEALFPWLGKVSGSFFSIYYRHPLLVVVLVVLGLLAYFVWARWWQHVWPNRSLRIATVVAGVVLSAHIASPFADLFSPAAPHSGTPDAGSVVTRVPRRSPSPPSRGVSSASYPARVNRIQSPPTTGAGSASALTTTPLESPNATK